MSESIENFFLEAKKWIGRETGITWGRYPVEYEPVRRWCRMVDFANPLYFDEEYARKTKYGGCICPPLMIPYFAGAADGANLDWPFPAREADSLTPPTPGTRNVGVGSQFEFFKPVHIGQSLGSKRRLVDVYIKPTRYDPKTFWLVRETTYLDQNLVRVAIRRGESLRFRGNDKQRREHKESVTSPQAKGLVQHSNKVPSFDVPLYFEDIEEGKEILGYSLVLDRLRFHLQTSGSQIFGAFHTDEEFARKQGLPTVFIDASFTQATLSRLITEWMGNEGWLLMMSLEMRRPNFLGDTITVKGKITRKYLREDKGCVDCDIWIENDREGKATWASATVEIPLNNKLSS